MNRDTNLFKTIEKAVVRFFVKKSLNLSGSKREGIVLIKVYSLNKRFMEAE